MRSNAQECSLQSPNLLWCHTILYPEGTWLYPYGILEVLLSRLRKSTNSSKASRIGSEDTCRPGLTYPCSIQELPRWLTSGWREQIVQRRSPESMSVGKCHYTFMHAIIAREENVVSSVSWTITAVRGWSWILLVWKHTLEQSWHYDWVLDHLGINQLNNISEFERLIVWIRSLSAWRCRVRNILDWLTMRIVLIVVLHISGSCA